MLSEDEHPVAPIVVKKYANRRLYDTESSIYITLDTLAEMVRHDRDFVVYDAKTGDDITRSVLTQIIMEEETRGRNMLPTAFLRQLIGFYGDSMQGLVPEYLERMMDQFATQRSEVRATVQRTLQTLIPPAMEQVGRQNLAMMDRALNVFAPLHRPGQEPASAEAAALASSEPRRQSEEIAALRDEIARLRQDLARANAILADGDLSDSLSEEVPAGGIRH